MGGGNFYGRKDGGVNRSKVKRRYDVKSAEIYGKKRRKPGNGMLNNILKIDAPITPLIHVD